MSDRGLINLFKKRQQGSVMSTTRVLAFVLVGCLCTLCAGGIGCKSAGQDARNDSGKTGQHHPATESPDALELQRVSQAANAFGFDLFRVVAKSKTGNLAYSPLSLSLVLGMGYVGARGDTEKEMRTVLHWDMGRDVLLGVHASWCKELQTSGTAELSVVNSLEWGAGIRPTPQFLDIMQQIYGVKPGTAGDADQMNMVNVVRFKGHWQQPFLRSATRPRKFRGTEKTMTVDMMHMEAPFGFARLPGAKLLQMKYEGGRFSMFVVLPDAVDGVHDLVAGMDSGWFHAALDKIEWQKVDVRLPRFRVEFNDQLVQALTGMGMVQAFLKSADFSGITGRSDLFVHSVRHDVIAEVDEEGTVAAMRSVKEMEIKDEELEPPPTPTFHADHPFVFMVYDRRTGIIVLQGCITKPVAPTGSVDLPPIQQTGED